MKLIFKFLIRFLIGLGYFTWAVLLISILFELSGKPTGNTLPNIWIAGINFFYFLPFPLLKFSSGFKNWMKNK